MDDKRRVSDGTWGEHAPGDVSVSAAMSEYHDLNRELTHRSRRTTTNHSADRNSDSTRCPEDDGDETDFDLPDFLRQGILDPRTPTGGPTKRLGISFRNLTVRAPAANSAPLKTLPRAILNTFGPDLWSLISTHLPSSIKPGKASDLETVPLIHDMTGAVRPGEILLVLGRPGSGCSTLLKTLANHRAEYSAVDGEVYYGPLPAAEQEARFRGEVVYCEEDDRHFPTLTVWQTLWFALATKTRRRAAWTIPVVLDAFLAMFGIDHTRDTLVGDEHVRGVSGGERKRVSLAETLATRASVVCWDNSTRGLDASTALSFAKSLRVYTDVGGRTTLVTLYQAGESIYELMDKVLVIDEGRMLFHGRADEAQAYFEGLGYWRPPRQTTADFLTSIADRNARHFQEGREATAPKTPEALEAAFRASEHYQRLLEDVDLYDREHRAASDPDEKHKRFEDAVQGAKSKHVKNESPYTVSVPRQIAAATRRQAWLFWGDLGTFYTKLAIIVVNALIVGSLFYESESGATSAAFSMSSAMFFSVAFIGWLEFAVLAPAIMGRATIERQRQFALYRPSAVVLARAVLDLPLIFVMVVVFSLPFYFLAKFDVEAGKFFIYMLLVYVATLCLTTMYRMFAALSSTVDDAIRFVSVFLNIMFILTGYVIPRSTLMSDSPWFGWFSYVNPVAYGYEALLGNEFGGRELRCSESNLVPRGPGADADYQGCTLPGSTFGSSTVSGEAYLQTSFDFSRSNLWRNFGIMLAFTAFFLLVNVWAVEKVRFTGSSAHSLVFAKPSETKEETSAEQQKADETLDKIGDGTSVFTFKDIRYTVPYGTGHRRLLNGVNGYAAPGKMVALMGSSGAGKTTLLNTLAQRQRIGVVSGDILVNGVVPGAAFKRGTGFCEQRDIHEGSSTVREALDFSALLRQEKHIPKAEKLAYVDRIVRLLELDGLSHALISSLTVEQRKRVTIGVELAARPSLLLFLDEPTSGLDSQSAFSIVRFLRRLADAGQAIICTIHQPSSDLIEQFDMILALNRGGNTFYFGPVGENGSVVIDYFARRGFPCPPSRNVAEFILETASRPSTNAEGVRVNWDAEWLVSEENRGVIDYIDRVTAERRHEAPSTEADAQFAASTLEQCRLLIQRTFIKQWREPSYVYGRLFVHVVMGILNGFTFWQQGNDVASLQNRMFTAIIFAFFLPPAVVNSVVVNFFRHRELWEDRELPSATYGWVAFCTANVVCELPMAVVSGTLYWLLWYLPVGFSAEASTSGYVYLMTIMWSFFQTSWGQWIAAFGPTYGMISNILPFFFVMIALFNGIFTPYSAMPAFWKYWMYYVNPSTWFARGVLSAVLPAVAVRCAPAELARFDPPPGATCGAYASGFVATVAGAGYLEDPSATSDCGFCPYNDGGEYMASLNVRAGDKWPAFGIMVAFAVANWALVYLFVYAVRVRGWTFGLGAVSERVAAVKARVGAGRGREGEEKSEQA
ncbi:hypothetical protein D7B24_008628 [Verticillium nonalfalfae]|uniref:ABC transporter domain-containing protein n=1 Tax=Verticillium nonalfalfae TaxID=1051616 RepID=A0A3M9YI71_9PEZI|nr:uncharacterized protein D7B24_008628 [Verticillium nonalfalfae]RNJ60247.1 hypothetical protein D7B24_008628 [Verticillium nonalfalfae]